MKKKIFIKMLLFIGILHSVLILQTSHGNVITGDLKHWAKNASEKNDDLKKQISLNHVGVLYFENQTELHNMNILQKGVPILLTYDLKKIQSIKVVPREKVEALLKEKGIKITDLNKTDTAIQIGSLLQVEYLITGQIQKQTAEIYIFAANIYHVPSKTILDKVTSQGDLFSELRLMEKELLFKIADALKISITQQEKMQIDQSITQNIKSLGYYLEGVEKSDQGQYAAANALYLKALQEDSNCMLALAAVQELTDLGLIQAKAEQLTGAAEAYSEKETVIQKPDVEKGGARHDIRNPDEREPDTDLFFSPVVDEPDVEINDDADIPLSILHIRTDATWDMAVDSASLQTALDDTAHDPDLRTTVDLKNTIPGRFSLEGTTYGFPGTWSGADYGIEDIYGDESKNLGLQTMGQDGYDAAPRLVLNPTTLEKINKDGFLAYAFQVEEDRLNKKIIEMHDNQMIQSSLYSAEKYKGIRERDAWLTQKADAQAGRVLKDIHGNWVRVQQYILRPDAETVQLLSVSLRNGDSNLSGLSTVNWATTFSEAYNGDLRNLPWSNWLNTQETVADGQTVRYVTGTSENRPPLLESMNITFTNTGSESMKNLRTFVGSYMDNTPDYKQQITGESLQIKTIYTNNTYQMTMNGSPGAGEFGIDNGSSSTNGFSYMLESSLNRMDLNFYVLGDGDTVDKRGEIPGYRTELAFSDIWDSLRINEPGAANIGNNNLEIQIDPQMRFYESPIDTIYIPMSRMVWKSDPSLGSSP